MKSAERHPKLVVAYRKLPKLEELDFAVVRTLDVHEVLSFLAGSPLFSTGSYVEQHYVTAYSSSHNYKRWTFIFGDKACFSDGSALTAEHWYHSIARTIRVGAGVHFNPRKDLVGAEESKDGYCSGLSLRENSVILELTEANKHFPRLVGKIEAAILPIKDASQDRFDILTSPGAGPYCIEKYEQKKVVLKLNPHFPGHAGRAAFPKIELLELNDQEAVEARIRGEVDFISPSQTPEASQRTRLEAVSQAHRGFGQTIFLSFRAGSPWIKEKEHRGTIANIIRAIPLLVGYEKTSTLLMGAGLGRLREWPEAKRVSQVQELPALKLVAVDRPYCRYIVEWLLHSGINVKETWVNSFNELYDMSVAGSDAFIGWNDFCAEDPYISLYNALNPDRPLFPDDGTLRSELTRIQQVDDADARDHAYRKLHGEILSAAGVIPVYWYWVESYAAKHLNLAPMRGGVLWTLGPMTE